MKVKLAIARFVLATRVADKLCSAAGFGPQYGDLGGKLMYREDNMAIYVDVGVGAAVGGDQNRFNSKEAATGGLFLIDRYKNNLVYSAGICCIGLIFTSL